MEISNAKRIVCRVASVLGILEALAWSLMAITAISIYHSQPKMDNLEDISYSRAVSEFIFWRFLYTPEESTNDDLYKNVIIAPNEFQIFMWIYLVINIAWLANSGFLFYVSRDGPVGKLKNKINLWALNTLAICLLDFIFVCLLGRDYDHCPFNVKDNFGFEIAIRCYLPIGIVLTVAAKGFVLWFINLGLAFLIHFFAHKIIIPKPVSNVNNDRTYPSIPRIPERRTMQPPVIPYQNPALNQGSLNRPQISQSLEQQRFGHNSHNYY